MSYCTIQSDDKLYCKGHNLARRPKFCYNFVAMRHLKLTPPLLIITMGYPGSGKTFFSRQFAEQYGLPRISEDMLRFELFEKPLFSSDESDIIKRIFRYTLEEFLKSQQTIICDGLFLSKLERLELIKIANKQGYRTLTVWLQTDIQTSSLRASKRDRRNPDDRFSFNMDQSTFSSFKNKLQRPDGKEQSIVISGKHAFKSQSLSVLRKITGMYAEQIDVNKPVIESPKRPAVKPRANQLIQ